MCTSDGEFGSTASIADCAHVSWDAGQEKYLQLAASMPTTLPPNGAWEAYMASISSFEYRSSM